MMRRTAFTYILFTALTGVGQDWRTALISSAAALPKVGSVEARDSLDTAIKAGLRELFNSPQAFTEDLSDLPLSRVDAPDGSWRFITWNLPQADGSNRFEGFLMVRDGRKSSLFELRDRSPELTAPEVPELGPDRWYGALYYQVIPVKKGGRTYYTLLGWKGYSKVETRKVIEVLSFRGGKPRFGAPLFGTGKLKRNRRVFGYSHQASMMLRYEPDADRIVLDHLAPTRADQEGQFAFYGPDLSYDAFVWEKGGWVYQRDIDARDQRRDGRPYQAPPREPKP
jgi:hypothetical protein